MSKRIILFCLGLWLASCAEKTVEPPENLIDSATMEEVLYDLSLLTAGKNTNIKLLDTHSWEPTEFVLKKYDIDSLQFASSDLYYASNPEIYEQIYTSIDTRLGKLKDSLEMVKAQETEKKKRAISMPKSKKDSLETLSKKN